jgi:hypothetical protein
MLIDYSLRPDAAKRPHFHRRLPGWKVILAPTASQIGTGPEVAAGLTIRKPSIINRYRLGSIEHDEARVSDMTLRTDFEKQGLTSPSDRSSLPSIAPRICP